jgi:hypothetical protein
MTASTTLTTPLMRFLLFTAITIASAFSQTQSDYYLREPIPLPTGEIMEISSIALMPNQQIAVATRRGDVWICSGA